MNLTKTIQDKLHIYIIYVCMCVCVYLFNLLSFMRIEHIVRCFTFFSHYDFSMLFLSVTLFNKNLI